MNIKIPMNRPPPKTKKIVKAKRSDTPGSFVQLKLVEQIGKTRLPNQILQEKTRKLAKHNLRVFKYLWRVFTLNLSYVAKGLLWMIVIHHDLLIQIALLSVAIFLEAMRATHHP